MGTISRANEKQCMANSQDTKTCQGMCSTDSLCALFGSVTGLALLVLSWVAVVIACLGIFLVILGIVAIRKTPYIRGKTGVLLSIVVLLACSFFAVMFLMKSQQAELQESLFQAVVSGNKNRVRNLVAKGADINKKKGNGYTLLHLAIESGNNQMVEVLLAGGADVNIKNFEGLTAMQLLLDRSDSPWPGKKDFDYEEAAGLLLANGATFDFQHKDGMRRTCIQNVISNNQNEMLRLMLENGADINLEEEKGGFLHYAFRENAKIDIIETLLSAGADLRIRDKDGNTALHTAAYYGRRDIVEALLDRGAAINSKNNEGMTALDVAKHRRGNFLGNRQEVIELLQEKETSSQQGKHKESETK
jgi:ankyrin repeat protein